MTSLGAVAGTVEVRGSRASSFKPEKGVIEQGLQERLFACKERACSVRPNLPAVQPLVSAHDPELLAFGQIGILATMPQKAMIDRHARLSPIGYNAGLQA